MNRKRLPFTTFEIPVPEFRRGYYSAVYFNREKYILEQENIRYKGLMQIFNKEDGATICGIDEALAVLRLCTGHWKSYDKMYPRFDEYIKIKEKMRKTVAVNDWHLYKPLVDRWCRVQESLNDLWIDTHNQLDIKALHDGDVNPAFHAVLTIEGEGPEFAHLESVYLGILKRSTMVATNTRKVVEAANGKPVLFFADRFDRWQNQVADGYAAMKSGAKGVASDSMGEWWGTSGMGTNPHALIAFYEGNTAQATLDFAKHYPSVNSIALVDFHNDCVNTSIEVAHAFEQAGKKLWAVRLDTSGSMVDKSIQSIMGQYKPTGVVPRLVDNVRLALDKEGFEYVKIVVSGGFNKKKISAFEKGGVPVDAYGVGSSLLNGGEDFTADIVRVNGKNMAKVGRYYRPGPDLKDFNWSEIE